MNMKNIIKALPKSGCSTIKPIGTATNIKGKTNPRSIPNLLALIETSSTDFALKYLARKMMTINFANSEGWKLNQIIFNQRCPPKRVMPEINTRINKNNTAAYRI